MQSHLTVGRHLRAAAALAAVIALGGTGYAANSIDNAHAQTGSDIGSTSVASASVVLGKSFVRQASTPIVASLPTSPPSASQLSFLSSQDPSLSGGRITIEQTGQVHADASVKLATSPGNRGVAHCALWMNGQRISNVYSTTFGEAGTSTTGVPLYPTVPMALTGSVNNVAPGTYNIGIRCFADRSGIWMLQADLHAVAYSK
ncbi:MAG: hypothetical protein LC798_00870 [Chloroflexi bacterium]|nr:hypothetical protein [Chloroflexota bacterium]